MEPSTFASICSAARAGDEVAIAALIERSDTPLEFYARLACKSSGQADLLVEAVLDRLGELAGRYGADEREFMVGVMLEARDWLVRHSFDGGPPFALWRSPEELYLNLTHESIKPGLLELLQSLKRLSNSEAEIMTLTVLQFDSFEIARIMALSPVVVLHHRSEIKRKLA